MRISRQYHNLPRFVNFTNDAVIAKKARGRPIAAILYNVLTRVATEMCGQ